MEAKKLKDYMILHFNNMVESKDLMDYAIVRDFYWLNFLDVAESEECNMVLQYANEVLSRCFRCR